MNRLMRAAIVVTSMGALVSCGGGDSAAPSSPPPPAPPAITYALPAPVLGNAAVFAVNDVRNDNSTGTSSYTDTTTALNMDGSYVVQRTVGSTVTRTITNTAAGARASQIIAGGNACTYMPPRLYFDFPLSVGKTWNSSWAYQCSLGYRENGALSGRVVRIENVTVPAGTFEALRVEGTVNYTASNDMNLTGGASSTAQYRVDSVCWWQTSPVRFLGCEDTYTYTGVAPANYARTTSYKRM